VYSAIHTDLYQLTMAQARFLLGKPEPEACFTLTFRTNPYKGGFAVCAGLEPAIEFLKNWCFADEDITYLRTLKARDGSPLFVDEFLDHLTEQRFTCDVDAVEEGRIVFAGEPLLRVIGPVSLCQMVETPLLNIINFSTLVATKATRCVLAARGDEVLEFGLRRSQGPNGGLLAARSTYVGGVTATSSTLAGARYGVPVAGTHAHSWIMSFGSELEAFRAYVKTSANNAVLLVDTYDTLQGVRNAIIVAHEMEARGEKLLGIRIDSGDLAWLSRQARTMLDEAGLEHVCIVASNALDEYTVSSLKEQGAKVDIWGIGTQMVTGGEHSALDGVYKMTAIKDADGVWQPRMKISDQIAKATLPGVHGLRRYYDEAGMMNGDMVYDCMADSGADEVGAAYRTEGYAVLKQSSASPAELRAVTPLGTLSAPADTAMVDPADVTRTKRFAEGALCEEMLVPIMRSGEVIYEIPALDEVRARLTRDMARLDDTHKRFLRPHVYPVGIEQSLNDARLALMRELRGEGQREG